MTTEIVHEQQRQRYAMYLDGALVVVLDYRVNGDQISFTHTFTNPQHRGKGLAAQVVAMAIDDVEKQGGRTVVPMCWYVADWFRDHPEKAGLLGH